MMLKLRLQYFGHLMRRVDSYGKDSDAGRDWWQEEKGTTEDEIKVLASRQQMVDWKSVNVITCRMKNSDIVKWK